MARQSSFEIVTKGKPGGPRVGLRVSAGTGKTMLIALSIAAVEAIDYPERVHVLRDGDRWRIEATEEPTGRSVRVGLALLLYGAVPRHGRALLRGAPGG